MQMAWKKDGSDEMLSLKRWHGKKVGQKISFSLDQTAIRKGRELHNILMNYVSFFFNFLWTDMCFSFKGGFCNVIFLGGRSMKNFRLLHN